MNAHAAFERIRARPIIAAIQAPSADAALKAANAAVAGGIRIVEVPLTSPGAYRVISDLRREHGDTILVGAGSVLSTEGADRAMKAGAQFATAPHTSFQTLDFCKARGVLAVPGAATPTEVMTAWSFGVPIVKVFPAALLGGTGFVKTLARSVGDVRLLVEGGVTPENFAEYLASGAQAVTIGAGLFQPGDLHVGNWSAIAERARGLVRAYDDQSGSR
jgi:2-dehydro-3-deoxyphosphogluconate aldolase/(4S)-4-hydroxy-2-oxoglutarate aldolase